MTLAKDTLTYCQALNRARSIVAGAPGASIPRDTEEELVRYVLFLERRVTQVLSSYREAKGEPATFQEGEKLEGFLGHWDNVP